MSNKINFLNKRETERLSNLCESVLSGTNPFNNKIIKRHADFKPVEVYNEFIKKYEEVDSFVIGFTDKTGSGKSVNAFYIGIPTKYISYNIFCCMFIDVERYNKINNSYYCNDISFKNRKYFTDLLNNYFSNKLITISVEEFNKKHSNKGIAFEMYLDELLKANANEIYSTALYDLEYKNKKLQIKCSYEDGNTSEVISYNKNNLKEIDNLTSSRILRNY